MSYQIILEFPNKKVADEFCGQMSDGFGENFCNFSFHRQKPDTDGTQAEHYEEVVDEQGRRTYFVAEIFDTNIEEDQKFQEILDDKAFKALSNKLERVVKSLEESESQNSFVLEIDECAECQHSSHSGAFTPGGAINICNHPYAPRPEVEGVNDWEDITTKEVAEKVFKPIEIHKEIPEWCPLKKGYLY